MLAVGNAVHLLIPSTSKKRILYPGQVIESDPIRFVAKFEDPIAPPVDSDVNAFCEVNGKFFQQGAVVTRNPPRCRKCDRLSPQRRTRFRREPPNLSRHRRQRGIHRQGSTSSAASSVVDISPEGFASIVDRSAQSRIGHEDQTGLRWPDVESPARVQSVKELPSGQFRYGLLVPRSNISTRNALQKISADMQRLQLKRLRGASLERPQEHRSPHPTSRPADFSRQGFTISAFTNPRM